MWELTIQINSFQVMFLFFFLLLFQIWLIEILNYNKKKILLMIIIIKVNGEYIAIMRKKTIDCFEDNENIRIFFLLNLKPVCMNKWMNDWTINYHFFSSFFRRLFVLDPNLSSSSSRSTKTTRFCLSEKQQQQQS